MSDSERARDIHAQAINAREKEQDFLKALKLTDEALLAYGENADSEGVAGVLGTRRNIFGHLYQQTKNKDYLMLAKFTALAAVELVKKKDSSEKALPYRDLASAYEELGEFGSAAGNFKQALSFEDSPSLSRPAVKSDLKAHLGFAEYMTGDKDNGLKNMDEAISELESDTKANKYEHDVWLTGALMRKALATRDQESLEKAREIIESNPELVLRKKQLEALTSELAS